MSRATEEAAARLESLVLQLDEEARTLRVIRHSDLADKPQADAALYRALLDERTELLKDRERIDWLESDMPTTLMRYSISDIGEVVQVGSCPATRRTLREAIDAAVPKSEEKPK